MEWCEELDCGSLKCVGDGAAGTKTWEQKMAWPVQGAANDPEGRNKG